MDAAAWMNMPQGSVDLGLSPVLSHESQSSHTLTSLSEPELSVLPPSLDLSFTESTWNPIGPAMYNGTQAIPPATSENYFVPAAAPVTYGPYTDSSVDFTAPQSSFAHAPHPEYYPQGPYQEAQSSMLSYPPVVHHRPLLPRTDRPAVPSQPVFGPQRMLRPNVSASQVSVSSVSSVPSRRHGAPQYSPSSTIGQPTAHSQAFPRQPSRGSSQGLIAPRPGIAVHSQPVGPVGYLADHTEDWSSFIQFDQDETTASAGATRSDKPFRPLPQRYTDAIFSYYQGYTNVPDVAPSVPSSDATPMDALPCQDVRTASQGVSTIAPAAETDEGRHRTHPLYSEGPHADGLYHCPYEKEPSCQHQPTKLKCNYE